MGITKIKTDCIVNAANNRCLGGGGVDGAIHRAAGKQLYNECLKLNGCKTGEAKMTNAYNIVTAEKIIHTVGPMVKNDVPSEHEKKLLKTCYINSMNLAGGSNFSSISFPCISTGVYGYDPKMACETVIQTVIDYDDNLSRPAVNEVNKLKEVIFVRFLNSDVALYNDQIQDL